MIIRIRGARSRVILVVSDMADCVVGAEPGEHEQNGYDPETGEKVYDWIGPECRFVVLQSSKLTLERPQIGSSGAIHETMMPGPWLDQVVRALGYEARRLRPRKGKKP